MRYFIVCNVRSHRVFVTVDIMTSLNYRNLEVADNVYKAIKVCYKLRDDINEAKELGIDFDEFTRDLEIKFKNKYPEVLIWFM